MMFQKVVKLVFLSDIKVTPEAGTLVTWPAGWPWVHNAEVPRSNDKYIITSWMCRQLVV